MKTRIDPCLVEPPPPPPVVKRSECSLAVCYDHENAVALTKWLVAIKDWADAAWITCGVK